MTVQRAYLEVVNGKTFMFERKRIHDEMPQIKLNTMKWFLWRATDYRWEYLGYFSTKKDMVLAISKYYAKVNG